MVVTDFQGCRFPLCAALAIARLKTENRKVLPPVDANDEQCAASNKHEQANPVKIPEDFSGRLSIRSVFGAELWWVCHVSASRVIPLRRKLTVSKIQEGECEYLESDNDIISISPVPCILDDSPGS
jgi:hypothetical protein